MKKIILALIAVIFSMGISNAQDLGKATEIYNNGATALSIGDKANALKYFQDALKLGQTIGDPAKELIANCKNAIPSVMLSIGKELYNNQKFDEALTQIKKASEVAEEYKIEEIVKECKEIIPQINIQKDLAKANDAFTANNLKEAAAEYEKVLQVDSTNKVATVKLIQCLANLGDIEGAKKKLSLAKVNGEEENASKVLGVALLKSAVNDLKSGKYSNAIKDALEANDFVNNPKAYLIAGQAATKLKKNADAIKYFEKYIEGSPKAGNAGQIALTIGALYQGQNNKLKAIEYYKKAKSYGLNTQQYIDALSK